MRWRRGPALFSSVGLEAWRTGGTLLLSEESQPSPSSPAAQAKAARRLPGGQFPSRCGSQFPASNPLRGLRCALGSYLETAPEQALQQAALLRAPRLWLLLRISSLPGWSRVSMPSLENRLHAAFSNSLPTTGLEGSPFLCPAPSLSPLSPISMGPT